MCIICIVVVVMVVVVIQCYQFKGLMLHVLSIYLVGKGRGDGTTVKGVTMLVDVSKAVY